MFNRIFKEKHVRWELAYLLLVLTTVCTGNVIGFKRDGTKSSVDDVASKIFSSKSFGSGSNVLEMESNIPADT